MQAVEFRMTTVKFDVESWVERLTRAMQELARVQDDYGAAPYGRRTSGTHGGGFRNPSEEFRDLYRRALLQESCTCQERSGPMGAVLTEVQDILSGHPAWAELLESSGNGEIWFEFPNSAGRKDLLSVVAGLMARGREAGEYGARVACSELALILAPADEADGHPVRDELLTGLHVVLFQGLTFGEEVSIGDDLQIVPFGGLGDYFDMDSLERLAPGAVKRQAEDFTAAIVKPFRWKPEFPADGPPSRFDKHGIGSLVEDADILIELLALYHAAPAVRVMALTPRVHRRACLLLGSLEDHRGIGGNRRSWMSGWLSRPVEARRDAIDAAVAAFSDRNGERYRHCAPVIARLVEALARRGRFGADDGILDVAIALERMYRPKDRGIGAQLQRRVAEFLGGDEEERSRTKSEIKHFYDVRSAIIHGPKDGRKRRLLKERPKALRNGLELARGSVVKMLKDGPPPE
jgi:hypothetical protein